MKIVLASVKDAQVIHNLMIQAFQEYANVTPPSSALSETVVSIEEALNDGEQALVGYLEEQPVAMARFTLSDTGVYFFRLSVIPEKQGQGFAKELIVELENYARIQGKSRSECKVRMSVPRNIELYHTLDYVVTKEEIVENRNGIAIPVVTMVKKLSN